MPLALRRNHEMIREEICTGKTIEEAIQAACDKLGINQSDPNVSVEVLEMPVRKLFRTVPAKAKVTVIVEDGESAAAASVENSAQETPDSAAPVEAANTEQTSEEPNTEKKTETSENKDAQDAGEEVEIDIDPEQNEKVKLAISYLTEVFAAMGVTEVEFRPVQKGEATILHVTGKQVSALIGRRGETMEALSYLASLVANRLGGDYIKLGLDVAGYRNKREADLEALAKRICEKVIRTGRSFAVEPMNPYERRIIHSAVGKIDGVRSESEGEGPNRRVVIFSTDPNASNVRDRSSDRRGGGNRRRDGGGSSNGWRTNRQRGRGNGKNFRRDDRRGGSGRGDRHYGQDRRSSVPTRNFSEVTPGQAAPVAPKRAEKINDADGLALYGKIEL